MTTENRARIDGAVLRGQTVEIVVDGNPVVAYEGETIAAALIAAGRRALRITPMGEARGLYCGMGVCFECVMTVDGRANVRTCQMPVRAGMRVQSQGGAA